MTKSLLLFLALGFALEAQPAHAARFNGGQLVENVTVTATSGGTTTLTAASSMYQRFTGSSNQTVQLPNATTMQKGVKFTISNTGSGTLTINYNDTTLLRTLSSSTVIQLFLASNSTSNGTWDVESITGSSGPGTVSSVGLSLPADFTISGSPVTGAGTLGATWANESAHLFNAGPTSGAAATPTWRLLVGADLPVPSATTLGGVESLTSVSHQWINSISTSGVPTQTQPAFSDISGNIAVAQMNSGTSATSSTFWRGDNTWALPPGSGTVSSVTFTGDGIVDSATPSTAVTTTGSVVATPIAQVKNTFLGGPTTGANANPGFRLLVGSDLPNPSAATLGGIESLTSVSHQWINSISTSGVPSQTQPAFSDISGSVAAAQLPNPGAASLGGIESLVATSHQWINTISTSGVPSSTQPSFSDISGSVAAGQLPNPSAATLGGIESLATVSHQWINGISTSGVPTQTQPAFTDISGTSQIAQGGTAVTSVTTAPTANAFAGWDANSNLSANNHIQGYATTATVAGTTTLLVGSARLQYFTGSTTQTVKLPVTSTLVAGQEFTIVNLSSGVVTLQSSGANTLQAMAANTQIVATVISTSGTSTASWNWGYGSVQNSLASGGTVTSVTFTGDGTVLSSAPSTAVTTTGTVTAALANANAATYLGGPYTGAAAAPTYKAFQAPTIQKFTANGSTTGYYFVVTSANATVGATYTNNGNTYTVAATIAAGTALYTTGASTPLTSGTLTKSGGTGDATITFSGQVALATYTTPAGALYLRIRAVGGGGGGAGGGTTTTGGSGGTGGTTLFGASAQIVCTGGVGGVKPGSPPTAGTGSFVLGIGTPFNGGSGQGSSQNAGVANVLLGGGMGGGSMFGPGGGGALGSGAVSPGIVGAAPGGGGGGAGNPSGVHGSAGGSGGGGVDVILTSPSATYLYTIGPAGLAGTAGTSGGAGGAGNAGYIEVTEYYQ